MLHRNSLKIILVLLFPLQLLAQEERDITGLWKGFMYNDTTQQNLRYEIAISMEKGKLYGYSHQYFIFGDKEFHGVKRLKIKRNGDEITTEEVEIIVHNYPEAPAKGVHQLNTLTFKIKGDVMMLTGPFKTNRTRDFRSLTGYVHVERKNDYQQSALVPHLQELGLAKNLSFVKEENAAIAASQVEDVLKPVATDEEVKAIIVSASKPDAAVTTIKTSNAPVVKEAPVAVVTPEPKKETPPVQEKPAAPPAVVKAPTPAPTVTQPVVVTPPATKPVAAAPTKPVTPPAPAVVKATPAPKPVATAPAKPVVTPTPQPEIVKAPAPPPPVVAPAPKPQPVATPTAAVDLSKRKVETIQSLYFKSDSLSLTLYDNGEVDGDTVSVILNGNVIMPKVGLSTNAVKKTVYTDAIGDSIQLVMYAESLGSLPPNTGLLIVYDGTDRYEIRFSGDMTKSAAIVFRRRK
jgi:hypothetical protein